jgi:acetyl esterase/lipase
MAAWIWLTKRVASEAVVIYGHSLGSGVATNLCLQLEEQQDAPLYARHDDRLQENTHRPTFCSFPFPPEPFQNAPYGSL